MAATPALMPTNNIGGPAASPSMIPYWIFQVSFMSRPFTNEILRLTQGQQLGRAWIEYHNDLIKKFNVTSYSSRRRREDVTTQNKEFWVAFEALNMSLLQKPVHLEGAIF